MVVIMGTVHYNLDINSLKNKTKDDLIYEIIHLKKSCDVFDKKLQEFVVHLKDTKDEISHPPEDMSMGEAECYGSIAEIEMCQRLYKKLKEIFGDTRINNYLRAKMVNV